MLDVAAIKPDRLDPITSAPSMTKAIVNNREIFSTVADTFLTPF